MATSKVVSRPSSLYFEDDEDYLNVPNHLKSETRVVLYDFLVERAENDDNITHEQRCTLRESTVECIREETDAPIQESAVSRVVRMIQDHGDEFQRRIDEDEVLQGATAMAIEQTDSSVTRLEQIMSHLKTIISRFLEVDENGQPQSITVGKISAIFYYCYSICKNFISAFLSRSSIRTFLVSLATSLIAYFAKTKFYDWLGSHGGWLQALQSLVPVSNFNGNVLFLIGGVVFIGIWGYNRYLR